MKISTLLAAAAMATTTLFAGRASAQDPPLPSTPPTTTAPAAPLDSVYLRNGGLFRGSVTEIVPSDHVAINVEGGERKVIPWAEVDRVVVNPTSPAYPTPKRVPETPAAAPAPAPESGPRVRVHITTPRLVVLYRRPVGSTAWSQVCTSPCDKELPARGTYRVVGNGVLPKEFAIQGDDGAAVNITVDPSSPAGILGGGSIAAAGGVLVYIGVITNDGGCGDYSYCSESEKEKNKTATALSAVGVAMIIGGSVIVWLSTKTDVAQSSAHAASTPSPRARPLDAFLREPTWRSLSSSEQALGAPTTTFPLLYQRSF